MKKVLLSGMALTIFAAASAQQTAQQVQTRLTPAVAQKTIQATRPADVIVPLRAVSTTTNANRSSQVEVSIGTTFYDLQSNYGAVGNRVKLWDDGTVSAVWTMSFAGASGFPDRGTGYNYWDGSTWQTVNARIESIRTGWPNVSGSAALGEAVVNHGTNPTSYISRPTKGTGTWTETAAGNVAVTWPRMVVGGSNGTTVHVIGATGAAGGGQSSEFYYSRSLDGGLTWDQENVKLPGSDSTAYYDTSVDGYDIDARGDVVAVVMGGFDADLSLWKSTDNGTTWTKTVVNAFPIPNYHPAGNISDFDGDGIADTLLSCDSGPALVIDNNNIVHIAVGITRILDDDPDPTADAVSYFPGTDGMVYWNETLPAGDITNNVIASAEDIDGSGVIEIVGVAPYQCSLTGMPTIGVDDNNNIHIAYSSVIENTTNGNPNPDQEEPFRNVYYMYSTDMGSNWTNTGRVEPSDFDEQAWPCMAKHVTSMIHLTYHKDGEPGNSFQPPNNDASLADPVGQYDVIYNGITNPVGIADHNSVVNTHVYPNPVHNVMTVDLNLASSGQVSMELIDVMGKVVYTQSSQLAAGTHNLQINVRNFAAGIYTLRTVLGNQQSTQSVVIQ